MRTGKRVILRESLAAGGFQHKSSKLHHDEVILAVTQQERDSPPSQQFMLYLLSGKRAMEMNRGLLETALSSTRLSCVLTTSLDCATHFLRASLPRCQIIAFQGHDASSRTRLIAWGLREVFSLSDVCLIRLKSHLPANIRTFRRVPQ